MAGQLGIWERCETTENSGCREGIALVLLYSSINRLVTEWVQTERCLDWSLEESPDPWRRGAVFE